jgi:hypothetical protein
VTIRASRHGVTYLPGKSTRRSTVFKAILALLVIFLIATFPATWLLMLFLGNVGVNVSYWGALPLGIVVSALIGAGASRSDY